MTNAHPITQPLALLDIFRMRDLEHSGTGEMEMLLLDLIHDLAHLEGAGIDRIVLREEGLQGFWGKVSVRATVRVCWTWLIGGEDLLTAGDTNSDERQSLFMHDVLTSSPGSSFVYPPDHNYVEYCTCTPC